MGLDYIIMDELGVSSSPLPTNKDETDGNEVISTIVPIYPL